MLACKGSDFIAAEVASCPGGGLALHLGINRRRSTKLTAQNAPGFEHASSLTKIIQNDAPVRDMLEHDVRVHEVERIIAEHAKAGVRCEVNASVRDILQLLASQTNHLVGNIDSVDFAKVAAHWPHQAARSAPNLESAAHL